jgi:predicted nucleic-acid-binding protein
MPHQCDRSADNDNQRTLNYMVFLQQRQPNQPITNVVQLNCHKFELFISFEMLILFVFFLQKHEKWQQ